jgi:PAS domain S-box-containing protein
MTPRIEQHPIQNLDQDAAIRLILEGTATETGENFFSALVEALSRALGTAGAWVTEFLCEERRLRALAFWMDGEWVQDYEIDIEGTPCADVIDKARFLHVPDRLVELYGNDPEIAETGAVSYMGAPLVDVDGTILGHLAVMDRRPMPEQPALFAVFQIFAARAAAELQRIRAEQDLRAREEKLGRLIGGAMDAILEIDPDLKITLMNTAAEKIFGCSAHRILGKPFASLLSGQSSENLTELIRDLDSKPYGKQFLWIPGGLEAKTSEGAAFHAEATLSRYETNRKTFHTLILRNVNDRLEAEKKIESLTVQAEYLKEEIKALHNFDVVIGKSEPVRKVLKEIEQVAPTNATVLITGETGTGKELVARAIHAGSGRRDKPLVKVNCAAIPANLVESELFGHEKGAFTGATQKRDGRFALAHGGTIFLDEVGELPLDLQPKLLRVLQEGEFEPVGSSKTRKVDVRVLAATNRDLGEAVKSGEFREDLFYRLNVFPIPLPPLRDRGEDIVQLAQSFVERFSRHNGKQMWPLSEEAVQRIKSYPWPGNVRELENVIERAVITSLSGELDLERILPAKESPGMESSKTPATASEIDRVLTMEEFQEFERDNLIRALEEAGWRVSGEKGAAKRLGMNPSTLSSRIKALGIERPR